MTYANTDLIQARSHWARLRLNYLKGFVMQGMTSNERDYIMTALWSKWNKAIQHGLIMPVVAWFKPKFRNLWSEDECVKWLEEHPDNLE